MNPKNDDELARRRKEAENFKREISEDHFENAFLIVRTEVNGLPNNDGQDDLLVLKVTYAESGDAYNNGDLKTIKYFTPKYHAIPLAQLILEACAHGGKTWVAPPGH